MSVGLAEMRAMAQRLFAAAVSAADPALAVRRHFQRHPDTGGIAVQVHGGGNMTNQFVRYRNIQVKKLDGQAK